MAKKINIGALISGGGSNLQAIIDACESGGIDGKMVFVGSDNPEAQGLERGVKHKIPTFAVNYKSIIQDYKKAPDQAVIPDDFDLEDIISRQHLFSANAAPEKIRSFIITRAIAEAKLIEEMKSYRFDLIVLAGFMRNLTPYFINKINEMTGEYCIMNIHPAILPSFPGVDGYGDTFRYGCKVGGCTVHFIDYGEDSGPIIGQKTFQVKEDDTLDSIRKKGLSLEWELYPECVQLFAQGRLKTVKMPYAFKNGKTYQRSVVKIVQPA